MDAGYIARQPGQDKWRDVAAVRFQKSRNKGDDERRPRRGNGGGGQRRRRYTDIEVMFWLARARDRTNTNAANRLARATAGLEGGGTFDEKSNRIPNGTHVHDVRANFRKTGSKSAVKDNGGGEGE